MYIEIISPVPENQKQSDRYNGSNNSSSQGTKSKKIEEIQIISFIDSNGYTEM